MGSDESATVNEVKIGINPKKSSLLKRTSTSFSVGSAPVGNEKQNKRISFLGDNDNLTSDATGSNKKNGSGVIYNSIAPITEETRSDSGISSTVSNYESNFGTFNEDVDENPPYLRKKAFLLSQLGGIDNPTFHDDNSSYVLEKLTLTTNRLNSHDGSEKL